MNSLTYVNIDELKVGDTIGLCKFVSFGWNKQFRYPIIIPRVVERITPKRTKFVLEGDISLDVREAKERLVVLNEEAQRQSNVACALSNIKHFQFKLDEISRKGTHIFEQKLSDEEIIEYHNFMKSLYDKYLVEVSNENS